jgi:hypothetical protein
MLDTDVFPEFWNESLIAFFSKKKKKKDLIQVKIKSQVSVGCNPSLLLTHPILHNAELV